MNPLYFPSNFPKMKRAIKTRKNKFSKEDDIKLEGLVKIHGSKWSVISKEFKGRTARQCRDRWNHYLDPETDHSEWTKEEDQTLMSYYLKCGNHWSLIATYFPKRTSVSIRNRCCKLFKLNDKNRYPCTQYLFNNNPYIMQTLPNDEYLTEFKNNTSAITELIIHDENGSNNHPENYTLQESKNAPQEMILDCISTIKSHSKSSRTILPSIDSFPFPI